MGKARAGRRIGNTIRKRKGSQEAVERLEGRILFATFTWNGTSLSGGLAIGSAATGALANGAPHVPLALAAVIMLLATLWVALRDARGAFG